MKIIDIYGKKINHHRYLWVKLPGTWILLIWFFFKLSGNHMIAENLYSKETLKGGIIGIIWSLRSFPNQTILRFWNKYSNMYLPILKPVLYCQSLLTKFMNLLFLFKNDVQCFSVNFENSTRKTNKQTNKV